MKKTLIGAAALALMLPHAAMAATDGQPGVTSTGSIDVTLTVNPPGATTVQVFGLDDFDFGTVSTENTSVTPIAMATNYFCLLRSDAGNVRVTVVQTNLPAGQSFGLQASVDHNNDGLFDAIPIVMNLVNPQGAARTMSNNSPVDLPRSAVGCTAASDWHSAHSVQIFPHPLPAAYDVRLEGAHTAQFTMTVSVP